MVIKIVYPDELDKRGQWKITEIGEKLIVSVLDYQQKKNPIIRLDKDHYMVSSTGEIKKIRHGSCRLDDKETLRRSFKTLRDIIDCNITTKNRQCVHWCTLTYAENMTDVEQLYADFRKFNQRLRYFVNKEMPDYSYEYITVAEPQARGAWHMHLILIWNQKAPFISNKIFADIWQKGFVKINRLQVSANGVGRYLCAYLTDISLDEAQQCDANTFADLQKISTKKSNGKTIIKGARLRLYPSGFRIYRCSKGIKKPIIRNQTRFQLEHYLKQENAEFVSKTAYAFINENSFGTVIGKKIFDISPRAKHREVRRRYFSTLQYYSELTECAEYCAEESHRQLVNVAREIEYYNHFFTSNHSEIPLPFTEEEYEISRYRDDRNPNIWLS